MTLFSVEGNHNVGLACISSQTDAKTYVIALCLEVISVTWQHHQIISSLSLQILTIHWSRIFIFIIFICKFSCSFLCNIKICWGIRTASLKYRVRSWTQSCEEWSLNEIELDDILGHLQWVMRFDNEVHDLTSKIKRWYLIDHQWFTGIK